MELLLSVSLLKLKNQRFQTLTLCDSAPLRETKSYS